MLDQAPMGVMPPPWWHVGTSDTDEITVARSGGLRHLFEQERGPVVLSGATLGRAGLSVAAIHPEQAALYVLDAVD